MSNSKTAHDMVNVEPTLNTTFSLVYSDSDNQESLECQNHCNDNIENKDHAESNNSVYDVENNSTHEKHKTNRQTPQNRNHFTFKQTLKRACFTKPIGLLVCLVSTAILFILFMYVCFTNQEWICKNILIPIQKPMMKFVIPDEECYSSGGHFVINVIVATCAITLYVLLFIGISTVTIICIGMVIAVVGATVIYLLRGLSQSINILRMYLQNQHA
jgi:hypothetical protein